MPDPTASHHGSCLCGAVTFEIQGKLSKTGACHCRQCRKQTGHYFASSTVARAQLTLHGEEKISWYHASDIARRGFCAICGSTLFWDPLAGDHTEIAMGSLDAPTHTRLTTHIFMAEKGDYYEINDGAEQCPAGG